MYVVCVCVYCIILPSYSLANEYTSLSLSDSLSLFSGGRGGGGRGIGRSTHRDPHVLHCITQFVIHHTLCGFVCACVVCVLCVCVVCVCVCK